MVLYSFSSFMANFGIGYTTGILSNMCCSVTESCPSLCGLMDCSTPGSPTFTSLSMNILGIYMDVLGIMRLLKSVLNGHLSLHFQILLPSRRAQFVK